MASIRIRLNDIDNCTYYNGKELQDDLLGSVYQGDSFIRAARSLGFRPTPFTIYFACW